MSGTEESKSIDQVLRESWDDVVGEADPERIDGLHIGSSENSAIERTDKALEKPSESDEETPGEVSPKPPEAPHQEEPSATSTGTAEEDESETASSDESGERESTPEAPSHWSQQDREMFSQLDKAGQEFLLRRHQEMEADYTRKRGEDSEAVKIGEAVRNGIDSQVKNMLGTSGMTIPQFADQLLAYHRLSIQNPVEFLRITAKNLRLDPAKVFGFKQEEAPQEDAQPSDPRLDNIERYIQQDQMARRSKAAADARAEIDAFSAQKNEQGQLLRPHFEAVKEDMAKLMLVDDNMDLQTAYDLAVYRNPELRQQSQQQSAAPTQQTQDPATSVPSRREVENAKAAKAARANKKGAGTGETQILSDGPQDIRTVLEKAADEIGMS